ncbi:glycine oxidase ThiO [Rhodopirellula maiorica SM1]|uniref:Glycine oxidase ThiO n=1 Tax=Rhodopirellula maiorica SM1 TaxID=1265738 RepID=M5RSB7_9BACT|nr:FAD-dependent oxidoreductase [Rhodopirellula maiorica]EMI22111.1 glycine oxidase ThiO [Rhodopirellula maiorica SM1]
MMPTTATIVGGGAIGLSLAWELSQRGIQPRVLEQGQIAKSTSTIAGGILPPANFDLATDPMDQLRGLSHRLFPEWSGRLEQTTGIDVGLRRCGGWYLANSAGEKAVMLGMSDYWSEMHIQCERTTMDVLQSREPALARWLSQHPDAQPWWVPDEYQIDSPRYLDALHQACLAAGVTISQQTAVLDIRHHHASAAVQTTTGWIESDMVIVCGGSWTGLVSPELRLTHSLIPIRGQILVVKSERPLLRSVINIGNRYVLCRDDGRTLIGSCEEEVGFDKSTTEEMIETLRQFAIDLVPELRSAVTVQKCAGLRPLTFDGFPMIGRVPEKPHLYVASGHYRSGIHFSPATAVCLADLITGQTPPIDLEPFRVGKQQKKCPTP